LPADNLTLPAVNDTMTADNIAMPADKVTINAGNVAMPADAVTLSGYSHTMIADTAALSIYTCAMPFEYLHCHVAVMHRCLILKTGDKIFAVSWRHRILPSFVITCPG